MLNTIRTTALSAVIALCGLGALPAAAYEGGLYEAQFGRQSGQSHRRPHSDDFWRPDDYRYGEHWRRGEAWGRRHHRECSPGQALHKAERMGLFRAWIRDVDRHSIRIGGYSHRGRVSIIFARAPHCPIISWR